MKSIEFMASTTGRAVRAIAGATLLIWGLFAGIVWLDVVGAIIAAAGLFDFCLFAPLFKMPLSGKKIRNGDF
ncbi:MAG: hypothetical protein RL672_459 [Actinomycetota bacterium]|jgi:hypothetical protein